MIRSFKDKEAAKDLQSRAVSEASWCWFAENCFTKVENAESGSKP